MIKKIYIGLIITIATVCSACNDFLDKQPISDSTVDKFWKNETDANVGIIAIYSDFSKAMASGLWNWGEIRADNFDYYEKDAPDQQELVTNNILIDNPAALWTNLYFTISKANAAIKYIPEIDMNVKLRNDYLAEAYAMRAWCYYYCIRVWGDVPLLLEPVESVSQGIYFKRTDKNYIIDNVILPDLEKAYLNIDKTRNETDSKRTRMNVGTVCALLMDVYAWKHDYGMVAKIKEERVDRLGRSTWRTLVSENGSNFNTNWRKMFFESTAAESVPEVWFRAAYDRYGNGNNQAIAYFARSSCKLRVSATLREAYESKDLRANLQWVHESGVYRFSKKFWDDGTIFSGSGAVNSDVDLVLYRYADIILLYAEALNALGRTNDAITELNRTRTRAGNDPFFTEDFTDSEMLLDAILAERQKEFVGEGKRWFDIVRTNRWAQHSSLTDEAKIVFPIHRDHLNQNPELEQNFPAYPYP